MRIGAHVSSAGGISKAVARGVEIGCEAIQIFGSSPQGWAFKPIPGDEIEAFRQAAAEADIGPIFLHAIYLINLGTPNPVNVEKGISSLVNYMELAKSIDAAGVIFHPGSHGGKGYDAVFPQTVEAIKKVLDTMEEGRWVSAWFFDHFLPPWSRTAEVFEHDQIPTFEGWSLLCGAAAITRRLRLGLLVAGNTYRNPALMAKMAVTADHMSNGRVLLGIGAGWNVREHEAYGWEFPSMGERSDRLEEACRLIKELFTSEGLVDFDGSYYRLQMQSVY